MLSVLTTAMAVIIPREVSWIFRKSTRFSIYAFIVAVMARNSGITPPIL